MRRTLMLMLMLTLTLTLFVTAGCGNTGTAPEDGLAPLERQEGEPKFEATVAATSIPTARGASWTTH